MAGPFALGGIAGIGNSFMKSYQAERDRIRQETKEAADQAWQNELRGRQRKAWEQEAAEQQAIARAMQPVESEPVYQVTDQAGSSAQTDDADAAQVMRDMAETKNGGAAVENKARVNGVVHSYPGAQKALSEANSPHRQQLRAADALAAINPKRSIEMRNQAMQSRSSALMLNKQERDEINDTFNTALVQTLDSQPNWWDGAVQIAQSAGGVNLVPEVSEDGQKVRLYQVDEKGGRKLRGSYATSEEGKLTFLDQASRQDYKSKVAILRANMEYQRSRHDKEVDRQSTQSHQLRMEQVKQQGRVGVQDRIDARQLAKNGVNVSQKPLTTSQQRINQEIDVSRRTIAEIDPAELKRKTTPTNQWGGRNPDFDPALARAASQAARRKYGEDQDFDARGAGSSAPPSTQQGGSKVAPSAADRFKADKSMQANRLGKQTDRGYEVFDSKGKLIGYYR